MTIPTTLVFQRGEQRFDMVGKALGTPLTGTDQNISPGLAIRLMRYAVQRMIDNGFRVEGWACEVSTMDADNRPPERTYCVKFINLKGGGIGIEGIFTTKGWPTLDHGLFIEDAPW